MWTHAREMCLSLLLFGVSVTFVSATCSAGAYGENCSKSCSTGCVDNTCQQDTGRCTSGCKDGYYGDFCCSAGQYGEECKLQCPSNCNSCTSEYFCTECKTGYYGQTCSSRCSTGCDLNRCQQENGACYNCKAGFYGSFCCPFGSYGKDCASKCPARCTKCESGTACSECESGYYGYTCTNQCSVGCSKGKCDLFSGKCTQYCDAGYYGVYCCPFYAFGSDCATECPAHCKVCESKLICSVCDAGYYGAVCQKQCSIGCTALSCRLDDGKCDHGCVNRFSGDNCCVFENGTNVCSSSQVCPSNCNRCEDGSCVECKSGFYNNFCSDTCPENCLNGACKMDSGVCSSGCKDGYSGDKCMQKCNDTNGNCASGGGNTSDVGLYVGVAIGVLVFVGLLAVVIVFLIRKWSFRREESMSQIKPDSGKRWTNNGKRPTPEAPPIYDELMPYTSNDGYIQPTVDENEINAEKEKGKMPIFDSEGYLHCSRFSSSDDDLLPTDPSSKIPAKVAMDREIPLPSGSGDTGYQSDSTTKDGNKTESNLPSPHGNPDGVYSDYVVVK